MKFQVNSLFRGVLCLASATALAASTVYAQLVNDGATNTLSNVTNSFPGNVIIGTNGSFTLLVLSNNCLLTNAAEGDIGRNASARSNEVRLVSATARWLMNGALVVGYDGAFNRLAVSNGALVASQLGIIGYNSPSASNNTVTINGAGSVWSNAVGLTLGNLAGGNRLEVSGGGWLGNNGATIGSLASSNLVLVSGTNSIWSNRGDLTVGLVRGGNQLVVSNGGLVVNNLSYLGQFAGGSNNLALVTGAGSLWTNQSDLYVGSGDKGNQLVVSNSATVAASNVFVGFNAASTNNRVTVDGGTLRVTNASASGTLDVRRGTSTLNAGLVEVDRLLVTNTQGSFVFNGGTLSSKSSAVNNGFGFTVGNGGNPATFILAGNGTHTLNGLFVNANATLTGNGTIGGNVAIGGTLSPGASIGKIIFTNAVLAFTAVFMEISKNGAALTNDQIQLLGPVSYDGALTVSNLGPTTLAAGDKFQLFSATGYSGSFSSLTLPPLAPLLSWTNKLFLDGSIEVVGLSVQTLPASAIGPTTATLNGLANSDGANTTAWFEWGTTTDYGNITPPQPLGGGFQFTNFSQVLTGLTAGGIYHFRAVGSNNLGVVFGSNRMVRPFLPMFTDDFDSDHSSNWIVNSSPGTNAADFFFDYSSVGIPPAPNSVGTTRGLKLEANYKGDVLTGLSVSPIGQNFTGDYVLLFDVWWNYVVERAGVIGATQVTGAGVGTAGTTPQWSAVTKDSVFFGVTGDGGTGFDYRAYSAVITNEPYQTASGNYEIPSGVYAASSVNNLDPYYASFGGNTVPAVQTIVDPGQMGASPPGAPGFRWHRGKIIKGGNTITFSLDDLRIATVDASPLTLGGGNILFNQFDVNSSSVSSGYPLTREFEFGLIDNVVVVAVDLQWVGIRKLANDHIQLIGSGVPERTYSVQAATNLNFTQAGSTIGTVTADTGGMIIFEDTALPLNISRFYRLRSP